MLYAASGRVLATAYVSATRAACFSVAIPRLTISTPVLATFQSSSSSGVVRSQFPTSGGVFTVARLQVYSRRHTVQPMAAAVSSATQASNAGSCAFKGKEDLYGGLIVDSFSLPDDAEAFKSGLSASLQEWKARYAGIWLKLPIQQSAFIPLAVEQGFKFHHAEAEYVMMTAWLPSRESTLPPNPSHQVGVGAVVFNKYGELLVVREKHGPAGKLGVWKLPTGLVHAGEDLSVSVVREGLEVEFDCVLALRQAHGFAFGKSDMFFLCGVRPTHAAAANALEDGRPRIQPCLKEVEEARWMPLEEYCQSDFVKSRPMLVTLAQCMTAYAAGNYQGFQANKLSIEQGRPDLLIYNQGADSVMPRGWENC